jgi:RIO kinase 1
MDSKISKADYDLQKMREIKRLKSVEDKRTGSEVFDRLTLETLYKLAKQG